MKLTKIALFLPYLRHFIWVSHGNEDYPRQIEINKSVLLKSAEGFVASIDSISFDTSSAGRPRWIKKRRYFDFAAFRVYWSEFFHFCNYICRTLKYLYEYNIEYMQYDPVTISVSWPLHFKWLLWFCLTWYHKNNYLKKCTLKTTATCFKL